MPWAIFKEEFNFRDGRFSYNVKPSPDAQERKTNLIDAAEKAGKATRVDPPSAGEKRKSKKRT